MVDVRKAKVELRAAIYHAQQAAGLLIPVDERSWPMKRAVLMLSVANGDLESALSSLGELDP